MNEFIMKFIRNGVVSSFRYITIAEDQTKAIEKGNKIAEDNDFGKVYAIKSV